LRAARNRDRSTCADGKLWFVEQGTGNAASVTTSGTIIEYPLPTDISGPFEIAAGSDENLWITENFVDQIAKLSP
jgi:streptogramin lyase